MCVAHRHAHVPTRAHTHTSAHARRALRMRAHMHALAHTEAHSHARARVRAHARTHAHPLMHTHLHPHTRAHTPTPTPTRTLTRTHAHAHAHAHPHSQPPRAPHAHALAHAHAHALRRAHTPRARHAHAALGIRIRLGGEACRHDCHVAARRSEGTPPTASRWVRASTPAVENPPAWLHRQCCMADAVYCRFARSARLRGSIAGRCGARPGQSEGGAPCSRERSRPARCAARMNMCRFRLSIRCLTSPSRVK